MADEDQDDKTGSEGSAGTSGGDAGANGQGTGDSGASGDAGQGDGGKQGGDDKGTVSQADLDAVTRRMQAADRRASEAEAKLRELADKDKSELERAQGRVGELEKELADARSMIDQMALRNAFFTDNKHTWHDPTDALALLDREGVEVKDGQVTGLAAAIEKLAKAKPHLLKSDDSGKGGGNGSGSSGASGSANNGKRAGEGKDDKRDYSGRFPALRAR